MRLYGKAFIIKVADNSELKPLEYVRRCEALDGKTGICVAHSFKIDGLFLALRVEDRLEVVRHSEVRIHPDEMQALQEDLEALIRFNKKHGTEIGQESLDG